MVVQLEHPVIIAGGGLVGLTLAQALKKDGIPYLLYERDEGLLSRYGGWGITLHWSLAALQACIPPEAFDAIKKLHNDPSTIGQENVPYRFFNLETGEAKIVQVGKPVLRVSRLKLREILASGLNIQWGVTVTGWETTNSGVNVQLSNGTTVMGSLLAGAEGKNSKIKRKLLGEERAHLYTFPLGFVGLKMRLTPEQIAPFRNLNPIFVHGAHPNGKFIFFSTISTPEVNGSIGTDREYYEGQLNLSWFIGQEDAETWSLDSAAKLEEIKKAATEGSGFFKELREAFKNIPDDTEVLDIKLQDWVTEAWPSAPYTTILGDAVHPMAMYRGEAANHGIFDAFQLKEQLRLVRAGEKTIQQGILDYEKELVSRGKEAVILSRKAGFEAHNVNDITEESALFQYSQLLGGKHQA